MRVGERREEGHDNRQGAQGRSHVQSACVSAERTGNKVSG